MLAKEFHDIVYALGDDPNEDWVMVIYADDEPEQYDGYTLDYVIGPYRATKTYLKGLRTVFKIMMDDATISATAYYRFVQMPAQGEYRYVRSEWNVTPTPEQAAKIRLYA